MARTTAARIVEFESRRRVRATGNHSMIVLCSNPGCGAVLRVAAATTPTETVMHLDDHGCYFECPRCAIVTRVPQEIQARPAATGTVPR